MAELITTWEAKQRFSASTTLKELDDSPTLLTAYELLQEEESRGAALVLIVANPELNDVISRRIGYPVPRQLDKATALLYGLQAAGNGYIIPKTIPTRQQIKNAVKLLIRTIIKS